MGSEVAHAIDFRPDEVAVALTTTFLVPILGAIVVAMVSGLPIGALSASALGFEVGVPLLLLVLRLVERGSVALAKLVVTAMALALIATRTSPLPPRPV